MDPHSPLWLSGQHYPAQYLIRQTRSMSRAQRGMVIMPKPPPPSSAMAAVKDFDLPDDDMFYQLKQQRLRESPLCNQQISCQLVEEHSLPIQLKCTHHIQCAPEEVCVCVALFPGPIPSVSMLKRLGSLGDEAMCVCVGILWISLISSFFPCPPPSFGCPRVRELMENWLSKEMAVLLFYFLTVWHFIVVHLLTIATPTLSQRFVRCFSLYSQFINLHIWLIS